MAFKERTRQYWLNAAGNECQFEYYTEGEGWQKCRKSAKHVHHIKPETDTLLRGEDPERNTGLPLCEKHHVRGRKRDAEHEPDFSFHPDIGDAYSEYREWKAQQNHLNSITGKRTTDYSTSPFAKAVKEHRKKAKKGKRYVEGSDEIDEHYERKMKDKASRYTTETGDQKPQTTPHRDHDPKKKRSWWSRFFD